MQSRHVNRKQYFDEQRKSTQQYVLPYIMQHVKPCNGKALRVLEVGCGEGGNLAPFLEMGCECWGIELSEGNFNNALKFYADNPLKSHLHLVHKNIYDVAPDELGNAFDIVFLRDVIEHIPEQEQFMRHLKKFMLPGGVAFFAFPPWRMPFGGHQQVCRNRWVSRMPYIHVLPRAAYRIMLKIFGLPDGAINELVSVAETGISIRRFRKIIRQENYEVIHKTHWLFNPNYQVKFGLSPRCVPKIFHIPYLQDFYTTAVYYLLKQG
ncbi:MAG: class I SAM-dependent methyltransferase [Prevotellaceae bacterium]|jgi:SAM-dependent methyltransferase|nr:class I SAM-dependent methyltransferase [Prevotellaceae bacterium]